MNVDVLSQAFKAVGPLLAMFVTAFCISKACRFASTCGVDQNDSWLVAVAAAALTGTEVQPFILRSAGNL